MDESSNEAHHNAAIVDIAAAAAAARRSARARLKLKFAALIRLINKPLHVIIAEHALPFLPPQSLYRLRSVSSSWNRHLSSPVFTHTHSHTRRSPSGLFLPGPTFIPFHPKAHSIPDPTLSFLQPDHYTISILSSSNGLVCCCHAGFGYVICNPSTRRWAPLPIPTAIRAGGLSYHDAVVLVFNPSVYNFSSDYFLVCAFEVGSVPGVYGFDVFSSESRTWRASNEICSVERIVRGSGVSAGGVACWRTTMQTVAIYDPEADRARTVTWPAGYDEHVRWEIAAIGGKLCCLAVDCSRVSVYALGDGDLWGPRAEYIASVPGTAEWRWVTREGGLGGVVWEGDPRPLRFQSGNLDAVVAVREEVYVLDLARRKVKHVLKDVATEGYEGHTVAYIGTLAPVCPAG